MSEENVALIRGAFRRFQTGDQNWIDVLDPDIEWDISAHPLPDVSNQGWGRERLLDEVFATYFSGWLDYRAEIQETIDVGDDVIVVLRETARLRGSDTGLDRELVQVWTIRNGLAVSHRVFPTKAEALDATGLSE
jgi:ketosteroid isomerase-like protein